MQTKSAPDLRKAYKTTVVIGLAMMASLLVYAILVETIGKQHEPFNGFAPMPAETAEIFRYALLGITGMVFFLIRVLNKLLLSAKAPMGKSAGYAQFDPETQKLVTAAVVTFALCESVAVFGLVLFLLQGSSTDFYLFLVVSLLYFSVFFPKYEAWEAWAKERKTAAGTGGGRGAGAR